MKGKTKHEGSDNRPRVSTRGRSFVGTVISDRMQRTATVEWGRRKVIPKYERYLRTRTRVKAHNPDSISAKKGDIVEIKECRPLSKTKHFIITKVLDKDVLFKEKERLLEEGKHKKTPKPAEEKGEEEAQ